MMIILAPGVGRSEAMTSEHSRVLKHSSPPQPYAHPLLHLLPCPQLVLPCPLVVLRFPFILVKRKPAGTAVEQPIASINPTKSYVGTLITSVLRGLGCVLRGLRSCHWQARRLTFHALCTCPRGPGSITIAEADPLAHHGGRLRSCKHLKFQLERLPISK